MGTPRRRTTGRASPVPEARELTVSRTIRFSAAHRLWNPAWSAAQNRRVYGRCSTPGGHGHNYELTVSVRGRLDPGTGMVVNVTLLRDVLERAVARQLDRRDLTTNVPFLAGVVPTMENLAAAIGARLGPRLAALGVRLSRIELAESEASRVTLDFP